jgi:hypothetical protein
MKLRNLITITIVIAGLSLIVACDEGPQNRPDDGWGGTAKVVAERIELRPLVDEIEALGTAKANESVEISRKGNLSNKVTCCSNSRTARLLPVLPWPKLPCRRAEACTTAARNSSRRRPFQHPASRPCSPR